MNRGMPQTYTAAAAMAWVSQVAAPTPNSHHATIVSPSAAVNVSPTFACTVENTNADMAKESAAKLVNVAPILVTPSSSVPAAYTAVVKEKGQSFECVLVIYSGQSANSVPGFGKAASGRTGKKRIERALPGVVCDCKEKCQSCMGKQCAWICLGNSIRTQKRHDADRGHGGDQAGT